MAKSLYGVEVVTFEEFLAPMNMTMDSDLAPLLKKAWNQAITSACVMFEELEGTGHGVDKALLVK
jgi:hypothetical protein